MGEIDNFFFINVFRIYRSDRWDSNKMNVVGWIISGFFTLVGGFGIQYHKFARERENKF
jgi:hypothetical protein